MYMFMSILEELAVSIFRVEVKIGRVESSTVYNYLADIDAPVFRVEVKMRQYISPKCL
jgi:hypothetical protein